MPEREYIIQEAFHTENVREISVDWNGNNYLVIYGRHINGGFFSIPNWGIGGELSSHWAEDILGNAARIDRFLEDKRASTQISMAVAEWETELRQKAEGSI